MTTRPAKSAEQTLINPGSAGVVYNVDGKSLGGGEAITVEGLDDVGKAAVDRGYLLTMKVADGK